MMRTTVYFMEKGYKEHFKNKKKISYKEYRKIINSFLKFLRDSLLEKSEQFIPVIGIIRIEGRKQKIRFKNNRPINLSINWELTKKYGKYIYNTNEHSDMRRFFFHWIDKGKKKSFFNSKYYKFYPTRTLKRQLAKNIKQGKEYIMV